MSAKTKSLRTTHPAGVRASTEGARPKGAGLRVAALFAGIGGIELGLERAGHSTTLFCEIDAAARAVLTKRFSHSSQFKCHDDVRSLQSLPRGTDLLTAGFPCQDLSQAGRTAGITGSRSGLVGEVFRLLDGRRVPWVLIENVPFMLQLGRGSALAVIVRELERLGYDWAYRIVDSRAFGLPQRRERVYVLASRVGDPRDVLLADDGGEPEPEVWRSGQSFGFYWTEGIRGLGAAVEAIPTLKGGSTIGIPSSPALLMPNGDVVTPHIRDAERLQGFSSDWTAPAESVVRGSFRWKLIGNSVTVNAADWIGRGLRRPGAYDDSLDRPLVEGGAWPRSAWSMRGERFASNASRWPVREPRPKIEDFLEHPTKLLSVKATAGFLTRARTSRLRFPPGFLDALQRHLERVENAKRLAI